MSAIVILPVSEVVAWMSMFGVIAIAAVGVVVALVVCAGMNGRSRQRDGVMMPDTWRLRHPADDNDHDVYGPSARRHW